MIKLIGQRLALGLLTLLAASALIFLGTELLPGDLASAILQNTATPESLAKLRLDLGLDRPAIVRYAEWLFNVLRGDFGHSLANGRDVLGEIAPRFANTMFLAAYAAFVATPLALLLGLISAIRQGGLFDRLINILTLMTISVPDYFVAYLLIIFVAVDLGLFPSLANVTPDTPFGERLYVAFLPMVTLAMSVLAHMMRMTRASVLAVMASPFIEMAILKGLTKTASFCVTPCRTPSRRSFRLLRSISPISSLGWSWSKPCSCILGSGSLWSTRSPSTTFRSCRPAA